MVSPMPRSSDAVSQGENRSADISVSITEEEGSELATILREEVPEDLPAEDSPAVESSIAQEPSVQSVIANETQQRSVLALCREIGNKLGSVSVADCLAQNLVFGGAFTVQSWPIVVRDFLPEVDASEKPRILIMGGIHGDEYSSISIMFKWMALLSESDYKDFHWRFAPTVNPDGLLDGQAIRQNANGVDLNRNFPSDDWQDLAQDYWKNTTSRNPRRFPGDFPASEPEVQWVVEQINTFKPDVIVSVQAPYHLLDYDAPP
ncbi:MAG: M14 family zinc carboxypeptidase [Gammaproteobacteria bacterium]|nr:M14 family zinc carboxypeptidase [Gammaproteobacteria bacterium]